MDQFSVLEILRPRGTETLPYNREVFYMDDKKLDFILALCLNKKLSWKFKSDLCQRVLTDFYPYKHDWQFNSSWDGIQTSWKQSICISCECDNNIFVASCKLCQNSQELRAKTFLAFQLNQILFTYLGAKANGFFRAK